jgi:tetratricopeptide (TPR) repeat protein
MTPEERLLQELREESPGAADLARVVSLAVLAEPQLLRRARVELLAGVDAGAEADLWLSRLVQTRSPRGITLLPRAAERLRRSLAEEDPALFKKAWKLTEEMHASGPRTVWLEENINRLTASPDADSLAEVGKLLQQVANTLVDDEARRGLAHWVAAALSRMPAAVRELEPARMLAAAAYLRLNSNLPADWERSGGALPEWLSWALPKDMPALKLGVRLVEGGVQLGGPAESGHTIDVPDTNPVLVELSWPEGDEVVTHQVGIPAGGLRRVATSSAVVQLRTARGDIYEISPSAKPAPAPAPEPESSKEKDRPTCFVVMGIGERVDYETGRKLNLDASYEYLIKPAVEEAGLECLREDEIVYSGNVDVPMYERLLNADVVIADLSTNDKRALYELGVRHGLRPYTTVIIAEDKFRFPFDIAHVRVLQYKHLGEDIGASEVMRFRDVLKRVLTDLLAQRPRDEDSPVYAFLAGLRPPQLAEAVTAHAAAAQTAVPEESAQRAGESYQTLIREATEARKKGDFASARALLSSARELSRPKDPDAPEDPYLIQQLALVTYKSKRPDPQAALEEARELLFTLDPETSNDTETLGMWGAVHKRLWDETKDRAHLDEAVRAYKRGFYLRNDYYNGINLAFVLNVRAAEASDPAEAVTDFVQARRVRREVIDICERELGDNEAPEERKYWVLVTLAEAYLGSGERERAEEAYARSHSLAPESWMVDSTREQREKLEALLADSPLKYVYEDNE